MSGEAIHQIWSRYSKELSRYIPLLPPVYNSTHHCAMPYTANIRLNGVVSFHMWNTSGQKQLHTAIGPNTRSTSIPAGPFSFMFSRFTIQNFRLQLNLTPPPPFAVHSIK